MSETDGAKAFMASSKSVLPFRLQVLAVQILQLRLAPPTPPGGAMALAAPKKVEATNTMRSRQGLVTMVSPEQQCRCL
jgi:hypothetical protein